MKERKRLVTALVLLQLLLAAFTSLIVPAAAATLIVPSAKYPTIQSALNAAKDGDIIQVSGDHIYYENLDIKTAVQLKGANKDTTIIDGKGVGNVVYVESSNVKIEGFTIRNGYNGIRGKVTYGTINITGNIIRNNRYGISLNGDPETTLTTGNTILANTFINISEESISISYGLSNTISQNQISGGAYGIKLSQTNTSTVKLNVLSGNSYGIYIMGSKDNEVRSNTETNDSFGVCVYSSDNATVRDNSIKGSTFGILFSSSDSSTILHNNVSDNPDYSIYLAYSKNNSITNNTMSRNRWGLYLYNSSFIIERGNIISYNTYGRSTISYATNNTIYQNNFITNVLQLVRDDTSKNNTYYRNGVGNYWSDYKGQDTDGDGIGETLIPHLGVDYFPLMNQWPIPKHDVAVLSIYESKNAAYIGDTIDFEVVVANEGSFFETFNVTLQSNVATIEKKLITNLEPNTNTTVIFHWNTAGAEPGYYPMSATAEPVTGETGSDLADNTKDDGTINLKTPLLGDINKDFTVNNDDLNMLDQAYGSTGGPPPSQNWNSNADLNQDNIIDTRDLKLLSENFGKTA